MKETTLPKHIHGTRLLLMHGCHDTMMTPSRSLTCVTMLGDDVADRMVVVSSVLVKSHTTKNGLLTAYHHIHPLTGNTLCANHQSTTSAEQSNNPTLGFS